MSNKSWGDLLVSAPAEIPPNRARNCADKSHSRSGCLIYSPHINFAQLSLCTTEFRSPAEANPASISPSFGDTVSRV